NPMINAGAIAVASLIRGDGDATPLDRVMAMFERYAGRPLEIDEAVYESERATGHRNRAIGHLLRNFEIVNGEPEDALDLYFRQCSVSITCEDLAVMAACLANGGINPVTGERVLATAHVERVLSVMGTCGMYDYAGEWIYRIGIPAKSGVAGGILAVLPGQLGIGVFSPALDSRGNSVRGTRVCESFSAKYGLHILNIPNVGSVSLRWAYDLSRARSKRKRPPEAEAAIAEGGHRAFVCELQGELNFASAESFSRTVVEHAPGFDALAIDFYRVQRLDGGAVTLIRELLTSLLDDGKLIVLSDAEHHPGLDTLAAELADEHTHLVLVANRDRAIERCEDAIVEGAGIPSHADMVPLGQNGFFEGLSPEAVEKLCAIAQPGHAVAGERIVAQGGLAESIYLIEHGEASALVDLQGEEYVRLVTYPPGTVFGEAELVGDRLHDNDVVAETDLDYWKIPLAALEHLDEADHQFSATLYRNIARRTAAQLQNAIEEIQILSS
ncbi:MAG: glutaminase, partial [Tepidiformaceae bacterium]